ncbi:hypothetical protein G5C01_10165, partial [Moraxella bovoculi]|nr:hypothetical protein [Moraxella bovoculi]
PSTKATTFDLSVNTDDVTITKGDEGKIKAKTTTLTPNDNGKIDAPNGGNENALVTAGDIANAINNSGFTLQANGKEGKLVKAGDTISINQGDNINVTQDENGNLTVATKQDVAFETVKVGDTLQVDNLLKVGDINITPEGITVGNTTDGRQAIRVTSEGNAGREKNTITGLTHNLTQAGRDQLNVGPANDFLDLDNIKVDLTEKQKVLSSAATVRDVLSTGFNLHNDGAPKDFVRTYDTIDFASTKSAGITVSTDPLKDNKISKITVDVKTDPNKGIEVTDKGLGIKLQTGNNPLYVNQDGLGINPQTLVENAQLPVVYTDAAGNKLSKKGDDFFGPDGKKVDPADVIASINNGKGSTTQPTNLANVAGNLTPTYNAGDMIVGPDGKLINEPVTEATRVQEAPQGQDLANMYNNAATVGDVLNAGFNLQENGWSRDFVKAYDMVNFIDGEGTKASVITDQNGKESMIKFDINVDDTKGLTIAPNTGKLGIKINADGPLITDKDGLNIQTDGTTIKVEGNQLIANTATLDDANKDGKIEIGRDGDQNALITAGDVANAINNSGFTLKANDEAGKLIKAGDTISIKDGDNIKVTQDEAGNIKIDGKQDISLTTAVFTDQGGNKTGVGGSGVFIVPNGVDAKTQPNDIVTLTV